jgi:hypothetical protein
MSSGKTFPCGKKPRREFVYPPAEKKFLGITLVGGNN